jgi:hypothetical protein
MTSGSNRSQRLEPLEGPRESAKLIIPTMAGRKALGRNAGQDRIKGASGLECVLRLIAADGKMKSEMGRKDSSVKFGLGS